MAQILLPTDSVFHFKLPEDGLSLHSAGFSNEGAPEIRFKASPKVPTLQEEDVATIFRLVNENRRPDFFYVRFPFNHPLHNSRLFTEYSPSWLRWTKVGKLLADADWNMKCLHVGVRSNEDKTSFKSWPLSSNLEGLATNLDFPTDGFGPVMMTCDHVTTCEEDDDIVFLEEPKMRITDLGNSLYSEYITEHYPAVAYYDEPVFLKMQELIKLIAVVEWFHEKGVKMSPKWMMNHTSKAKEKDNKAKTVKRPPLEMIPQPSSYERPSKDVTVKTFDACLNKAIAEKEEQYYGYVDFGGAEIRAFKADGTECPPLKCLKVFVEETLGSQKIGSWWFYIPIQPSMTAENLLLDNRSEILKKFHEQQSKKMDSALVSANPKVEDLSSEKDEIKVRLTDTFESETYPSLKRTLTMTATVNNYAVIPKDYLQMPILGNQGFIFPDVQSMDELIRDLSVPKPAFWQHSIEGIGKPTATGGVCTSSFEHRRVSQPTTSREKVSVPTANYKRSSPSSASYSGGSSSISSHKRAPKVMQGVYSKTDEILSVSSLAPYITDIARKFSMSWRGMGPKPDVVFVFEVKNSVLEKEWNDCMKDLREQEHQMFYHGTSVCETITTPSGQLCKDTECGICGISNNGMSLEFAGRSFPEFQRFGKGIYLTPNSSKSDDYTVKNKLGYRAMLLCDVLLGRQHIIKDGDSEDKQGPHPDFDSIVVEKGTHRVPEIVVFDERAVLPRYIIVYKKTDD